MNIKYLLEQLFEKTSLMRKAQKDYYAYKGDPRTDPMKKALLQQAQSKEQDVDRLLLQILKAMPELAALIA